MALYFASRTATHRDPRHQERSGLIFRWPASSREASFTWSRKLLAAHFADVSDRPALKRHQGRIRPGLANIERRIANEHDRDQGPRRQIAKALRLLIDCQRLYKITDAHGKRLASQTFTTGIDIDEDEEAALRLAEPFAVTAGQNTHVRGSTTSGIVDRGGLQPREGKRIERLEAVWELAKRGLSSSGSTADSGLDGAVTEPKRRSRTPLTAQQMDAIHTARERGESVMSIARRFQVSRMTVWEKTRTT